MAAQNSFLMQAFTNLAVSAPFLLVYLAGIVLAIVFMQQYPRPAVLTLIASLILLVTTIAMTFLHVYLFEIRVSQGWTVERFGWTLSALNLFSAVIRAAALGLLLAAVFVGRKAPLRLEPAQTPKTQPLAAGGA